MAGRSFLSKRNISTSVLLVRATSGRQERLARLGCMTELKGGEPEALMADGAHPTVQLWAQQAVGAPASSLRDLGTPVC